MTADPQVRALPRKRYELSGYFLEVPERYDVAEVVGRGAYGVVARAVDTTNRHEVAIKMIGNVFQDLVDGKRMLREVKLLSFLRHVNLLHAYDVFRPRANTYVCNSLAAMFVDPGKPKPPPKINHSDFYSDIYVVTELMATDLAKTLRARDNELNEEYARLFIYQMCAGLHYMHTAGVIHRDLKPANMMLSTNCDLKIGDFGLARLVGAKELTDYVMTRWYRPPELLLAAERYDTAVDMWGVGLIAIECLTREPAFPGTDYLNQIVQVVAATGPPTEHDLRSITSKEALEFVHSLPRPKKQPDVASLLPAGSSRELADFVRKLVVFDPDQRLTAQKAMQHPWLASLYHDNEVMRAPRRFQWQDEDASLTLEQLKESMKQEVDEHTLENWRSVA